MRTDRNSAAEHTAEIAVLGYRLDATVRVPGKSCDIVGRVVVAEIVQQKKRIEILGLAETEGALEFDSCAMESSSLAGAIFPLLAFTDIGS